MLTADAEDAAHHEARDKQIEASGERLGPKRTTAIPSQTFEKSDNPGIDLRDSDVAPLTWSTLVEPSCSTSSSILTTESHSLDSQLQEGDINLLACNISPHLEEDASYDFITDGEDFDLDDTLPPYATAERSG